MEQQESFLKFGKLTVLIMSFVYLLMGWVCTVTSIWMLGQLHALGDTWVNFYMVRIITAVFGFLVALLLLPRVLCWIGQRMQAVGQWMQKDVQGMQEE